MLAACGSGSTSSSSSSGTGTSGGTAVKGGTLRVAASTPAAAINPLTVADAGGLLMLNQTGEFLIFDSNLKLALQPMLALSWKPNKDGSVWTFKLRTGVKFHNGKQMTADDVVYTFKQLSDPKNASNALSTFTGVLTPSGVKKVDASTVEFHLEAPNGNFPYLVSSDNYNAIIVPAGTDFGKWQKTFIGTGAFKLGSYTQNVGASFVPNPDYWGTKPLLAGHLVQVLLQPAAADPGAAGRRRRRDRPVRPGRRDLAAEQLDLQDHQAQVRQPPRAVDAQRPAAVQRPAGPPGGRASRWTGRGWWPRCSAATAASPTTIRSVRASPPPTPRVPQRDPEHRQAKQLLSRPPVTRASTSTLTTEQYQEIPQLAQVIQQDAEEERDQHQAQRRDAEQLLRQGHVRQLRLARRAR